MSLNDHTATYAGTGPTLAAPTVSESIVAPDENTQLLVVVGGTATTVTIVRPGNDAVGTAVPDMVIGPLTNATRIIKVDKNYRDPTTGNAAVTFSQITGVTASVIRSR